MEYLIMRCTPSYDILGMADLSAGYLNHHPNDLFPGKKINNHSFTVWETETLSRVRLYAIKKKLCDVKVTEIWEQI